MRKHKTQGAQPAPQPMMQRMPPGMQSATQMPPAPPPGYILVPTQDHKRGLRKMSWFILVVNALFLAWVIAGAATAGHATNCGTLDKQTCQAATDVGTGIGVAIIVVIWVVVDFILLIIWLVTRPRQR